jgi:hypothetical protein
LVWQSWSLAMSSFLFLFGSSRVNNNKAMMHTYLMNNAC